MKATTGLTKDANSKPHVARVILSEADCIAILSQIPDSKVATDLRNMLREARQKAAYANVQFTKEDVA